MIGDAASDYNFHKKPEMFEKSCNWNLKLVLKTSTKIDSKIICREKMFLPFLLCDVIG